MSNWHALTQTALLGTRRAEPPKQTAKTPTSQILARLDATNPAATLLALAGTKALYEDSGSLPDQLEDAADQSAAPLDQRPTISPQAADMLNRMLTGSLRFLLEEFFTEVLARGLRLPDEILPAVLSHGMRRAPARAQIINVVGPRGHWLAAQNPNWVYAAQSSQTWQRLWEQWRAADLATRLALLQPVRTFDPALGLALVESTWKADSGNDRFRCIKALAADLSMADEPFLELALDDRSHLVRKEAATQLAALPESRFARRMQDYIGRIMRWTPDQPRHITLEWHDSTPQMMRDGVPFKPEKEIARLREKQLVHILGATPLDHWPATPQAIIAAIETTRWKRTLTTGFTHAAYRQRRGDWALAILQERGYSAITNRLITVLEIDQRNGELRRQVERQADKLPLNDKQPLFALLRYAEHGWDADFGRIWLNLIADHIRRVPEDDAIKPNIRAAVTKLARLIPPQMHDEALDILWPTLTINPQWQAVVKEFLRVLRFRHDMLNALNQTPYGLDVSSPTGDPP